MPTPLQWGQSFLPPCPSRVRAAAVPLPTEGAEHLIDNEAFLILERLPRRIVLVGGGYIAAEFSHVAARAGAEGLNFRVNYRRTSDWYSSRRVRESVAGYEVLVEGGSERVLGACLPGPHADEMINLLALVMRQGLSARAIKETMFAYPTGASDIGYMVS
jgi:pyruvate/2-oxoglutarate dehydrogenase complex dihydrolipoamide dehydrogenase (E3) component